MTINQTNVDVFSIPMALSVIYKNNFGARRMSNGPVGISKSVINSFKTAATGTVFWQGLRPNPTNVARIIAPQHQPNQSAIESYNDNYIEEFWNAWQSPSELVFYPQSTGPSSSWTRATLQTTGPVTSTANSSVATIQAFGANPVTFEIFARDIYQKCDDLYSNSGVWATATSGVPNTELNVKAFLAASLTRGVAQFSGDFLGTYSYVAAISAANTRWNDYANRGNNFYQNIEPNIYGKIIHDNAKVSTIDSFEALYAYGIAYDDTYGYSSTVSSAQLFPANDTQVERAIIDIYENDNL